MFSTLGVGAVVPISAILLLTVPLALVDDRRGNAATGKAVGIVVILFGASLAPVLWAYPVPFVMADQVWMTSLLFLTVAWGGLAIAARLLFGERRRTVAA